MYEATKPQSQRLHQFLADMTRLVELSPAEDELLTQAQQLMAPLLTHDDWLHPELSQAHPSASSTRCLLDRSSSSKNAQGRATERSLSASSIA
jgi:predicted metal-dependent enzyme (double-stranded beta helix superfamily)